MLLEEIRTKYIFNDGNILTFHIDYAEKRVSAKINVRKLIARQKFSYCRIQLEFTKIIWIDLFEDFQTDSAYSNITFLKLENGDFYLSLDPFGNSGMPHAKDNLVLKSKALVFIDEILEIHHVT
jgi:hypothetical protein